MKLARIILFTNQMDAMSRFYSEILGLEQVTKEKGWQEFAAGGTNIALHSGPSSPGKKGPKIVFHAEDVPALAKPSSPVAQPSAKPVRETSSASATAKTPTEIPFSFPTARPISEPLVLFVFITAGIQRT